uniref:(northern house mosquito) hypothetical protein n=1 Tax=Culex pipiens TaxID=7175 RepID=A0A8D8AES2_CULPI
MRIVSPQRNYRRAKLEKSTEPYCYNSRGNLVFERYGFSKTSAHGSGNVVYWRCTGYRKHKCKATLKTQNKDLYVINARHSHEPNARGSVFPAALPIWQVRFAVV